MLCLFLIIFNFLGVQLFHVFFGQDAKILFEAGGEVLRVLESYLVGEVADTHGGVFLRQPAVLFCGLSISLSVRDTQGTNCNMAVTLRNMIH